MAEGETSRTNVLLQRAGCAVFLAILAAMGTLLLLERLGLVVNTNQGWNALGNRASLALAPDVLRPGENPALDRNLLADANVVGEALGTPFVAVEGYHLHLRPKRESTGLRHSLVYVVRDARGALSSFALPLLVHHGGGVWVDHMMMRQQRMPASTEASVSPTAACVHAADAEIGSCRLLPGPGRQAWECECTTAGALVP